MEVTAITAEYNPFHNGHAYHVARTKELTGGHPVMAVMSGNFVQRGEPAILSKRDRARAALLNGVDLVVELPVPWATAGAERFARGAVYLAAQSGVVSELSFGCESADTQRMERLAIVLSDPVWDREIRLVYNRDGCSYAQARQLVAQRVLGEDVNDLLTKPDNILATEYIKAIRRFDRRIRPLAVARQGADHDAEALRGRVASGMAIRTAVAKGRAIDDFVPADTARALKDAAKAGLGPVFTSDMDRCVLSYLRRLQPEALRDVPDVSEGIENRIIQAAREAVSLPEVFDLVKTKRYTHSRIRRIILNGYLGITKADVDVTPPYLRVLGFNETGREILAEINRAHHFPVVTKHADLRRLDRFANRVFALESGAQDLYYLATKTVRPCGTDMTDDLVIVGKDG